MARPSLKTFWRISMSNSALLCELFVIPIEKKGKMEMYCTCFFFKNEVIFFPFGNGGL